jgi:hypothetical protein
MIKRIIKRTNNGAPPPEKTKFQLDKEGVAIRNKFTATREKSARLLLAKAREDLVDKDLILKQATFLYVAMRQKMLSAPLAYYRRFLHLTDPHQVIDRLTAMQHELLRELKDMPKKITDPNWMESLDDED